MIELFKSLVGGIIQTAVDLGLSVLNFSLDTLMWLHTTCPRLEGLLVGIGLAWLLRKESDSPLIRAISAPMKLVLDILDLVWDQIIDFSKDVLAVVKTWLKIPITWVVEKTKKLKDIVMQLLVSIREKLVKKKEE
ncbi:hypothetical protein OAA09_00990 [bacterium]|nr:hypothetical protein [bacterium]